MRTVKPLLVALFVIVSISFSTSEAVGQDNARLPSELNSSSSLSEILEWLNNNAFPYARVSLKSEGAKSQRPSGGLLNARRAEELVFSQGFKLASVNGCLLTLRNDEVQIIDSWTLSFDPSRASLARFIINEKNGKSELTPQSGLLFIPLDKMSYKRGKGPYRLTKNPEEAKLLGTWRTKFEDKGFFRHSVFEMEMTASEQSETKEHASAGHLTFTFDSKELAERFNAAFRQAIKLCATK